MFGWIGKHSVALCVITAALALAAFTTAAYSIVTNHTQSQQLRIVERVVRESCSGPTPSPVECRRLLTRIVRYAKPGTLAQLRGPAGPRGSRGPSGAIGARGATGIPGRTGLRGKRGATGTPGATGAIGPPGAVGPPGTVTDLCARLHGTCPR
jgi:hypothetical protein